MELPNDISLADDQLARRLICGGLLGIRCLSCDHRAVLDAEALPVIQRGNMTPLYSLNLACRACDRKGSGKDHWGMCTPFDREEADRFMRGYDIGKPATLHR